MQRMIGSQRDDTHVLKTKQVFIIVSELVQVC